MADQTDGKEVGAGTTGGAGSSPGKITAPAPTESLVDRLSGFIKPATAVTPTAPKGVPEPVILEEHVVEKPPVPMQATPVAPPIPVAPPPPPPPKEIVPPSEPKPIPLMPRPEAPAPSSTISEDVGLVFPNKVPEIKMPDSLMPETLASVAMPPSPETPIAPPVLPPQPMAPTINSGGQMNKPAAGSVNINTDIEKILREVKLPEKRDFKGAADAKEAKQEQSQVPTSLAGMVVKPPTDAEAASAMTSHPDGANISSVHTLKDDLQHAVKEKKMSLVRAVSLEQDKKRTELVEEDFGRKERRKRVGGVLFASALLFLLGAAALFGVYLVMMSHSGSEVQQLNSLVFAEQSVALPLDDASPSELKRRVAAQRQAQTGSLGSITSIVPIYQGADAGLEPQRATTVQFLQAIGANAPDNLLRSVGTSFFFGLHVVDKNAPVLVIPITNYDRAFAGMLEWEHTINADLAPTFTPVPRVVLDSNGIPSERIFLDDVMRNYDVRELKDDSGQIQLYYSFPSPNLLIIAESPYSFPELLSRLQSVRKL